MRKLFKRLDEGSCYEGTEEGIQEARAGDFKAIERILERRCDTTMRAGIGGGR